MFDFAAWLQTLDKNFDFESLLSDFEGQPASEDLEGRKTLVSMRKSVLKVQQLNLALLSLEASKTNDAEMEERLRVLSQQHSDIINRFSADEEILRRRLVLWNTFRTEQQVLKTWVRVLESEKAGLDLRHLQLDTIHDKIALIQVNIFRSLPLPCPENFNWNGPKAR